MLRDLLFRLVQYTFIYDLYDTHKLRTLNREWRKKNHNNRTDLGRRCNSSLISVGKNSYGTINLYAEGRDARLIIGNYVSIAPGVMFLVQDDHNMETVSTYPFKVLIRGDEAEALTKGDIIIDDDVWIGAGVTVMSGVHICQGAVIAAGAVVTKDVEPYAIYGGVPAKIIRYRFPQMMVEELLKINYGSLDEAAIMEHIDELYMPLQSSKQIEWMLHM